MRFITPVLLCAVAAGCGDYPPSARPTAPATGIDEVLANAPLVIDPAGRSVWLLHGTSAIAVTVASGTAAAVYPLTYLDDVRFGFVEEPHALLFATDGSGGCPLQTDQCSRAVRFDTTDFSVEETAFEGSRFLWGTSSPLRTMIALAGGADGQGLFIASSTSVDPEPIWWGTRPGGVGWSVCPSGCEERLWAVGAGGVASWPVIAGEIATEPDVFFDMPCEETWISPYRAVAATEDGRLVAIVCRDGLYLYNSYSGALRDTGIGGPASFTAGGTHLVTPGRPPSGEDDDDDNRACLRFTRTTDFEATFACRDASFDYYVGRSGVFASYFENDASHIASVSPTGFDEIASGVQLSSREFVERPSAGELWVMHDGVLFSVHPDVGATAIPVPFSVEALGLFPAEDRLALLGTSHLAIWSVASGSASVLVPLP